MKLIQNVTLNATTKVGEYTCKSCSAKYEICFADMKYKNNKMDGSTTIGTKTWYWECDTCGDENIFRDDVVERKLELWHKVQAKANRDCRTRNCDYD